MTHCNETNYTDIRRLELCPILALNIQTLNPTLCSKVVGQEEVEAAAAQFTPLPMKPGTTATLKENATTTLHGLKYDITLTFEADPADPATEPLLQQLMREVNAHVVATTFPRRSLLVPAAPFATRFKYELADGKLQCELRTQSLLGIMRVD